MPVPGTPPIVFDEDKLNNIPPGTRAVYKEAFEGFKAYCSTKCFPSLPATDAHIEDYLKHLYCNKGEPADPNTIETITNAEAAIKFYHDAANLPPVCLGEAWIMLMRGFKCSLV